MLPSVACERYRSQSVTVIRIVVSGYPSHPKMPLRGLSLSIEVLLKMTNRMNKKTTTSLPRLIRGRMSMNLAKYTPLYEASEILGSTCS